MPAIPDGTTVCDALVIGSGQAGNPLAASLAKAGLRTALVERAFVGGTCVNVGCTPTKTMVASARVAYLARRSADFGVHTEAISVDQAKVRRRKQEVVESFRNGSRQRLEGTKNLELIFGEAKFAGPKSVEIRMTDGRRRLLQSDRIFINTGCRPALPAIGGLESVQVLDSSSIMELETTPDHLLVLGGGYVGLEFGQMFRRLGSRVTIVQRGSRLLPREDADVADAVAAILREDGIEILLGTQALRVERAAPGGVRLAVRAPSGERALEGSHLLAAAGRVPNTEALYLEAAGVEVDASGFIKVNGRLETSVEGVYALGDVKGGPAFTHISYDDFRILRTNLLEGGDATTSGRLVPYTVFIDPELGRIGLTETEARGRGLKYRVARMPMSWVARAIEMGETRGFMKAIVESGTDRILGCAVLGVEGGELMSQIQIAMMGGIPCGILKEAIFAHPTLAESLNNLFLHFDA